MKTGLMTNNPVFCKDCKYYLDGNMTLYTPGSLLFPPIPRTFPLQPAKCKHPSNKKMVRTYEREYQDYILSPACKNCNNDCSVFKGKQVIEKKKKSLIVRLLEFKLW